MSETPWWKGPRGEWYVVAQFGLFALVVFGPRTWQGAPGWPAWAALVSMLAAALLGVIGALFGAAGLLSLGRNLAVRPHPKEDATLVEGGAYALVRHPIYSGLIALAFAWGLWVQGPLTLGYAFLLFVLLDLKSRREERWLNEKFPAYADYQRRVRKLIPFIY